MKARMKVSRAKRGESVHMQKGGGGTKEHTREGKSERATGEGAAPLPKGELGRQRKGRDG